MRYFLFIIVFISQFAFAQDEIYFNGHTLAKEKVWVDSIYNQLTFEEKVGQLFMVAAYSNKDAEHVKSIEKLIEDYKIGGLIFFQGGPVRQAKLTNKYQSKSKIPLFVGIDAEWGLSMRLDSTYRYPWNMTLGAVQDLKLIEKMGKQMAKQTKRLGLQFNFAPVLDINTNPSNPIIGNRSFGENKENVTNRALALMKGIQSEGVFATGKHFPGHGDTATDSHHTLPSVTFSKERLNEVEFYPYKKLFKEGLASVMVAHLNVPSLESREGYPTSISHNVVTDLLQKELGFNGLIFTDALNMKGASNFKQPGDIDLEAFLAGNDILLFAENVPVAVEKFCKAYYCDSLITDERLEQSVKKILKYKFRSGLGNYKPIDLNNLYEDLNTPEYEDLNYELYENAVTVLKKEDNHFPIKKVENEKIAYVKLGDDKNQAFLNSLKTYAPVTEVYLDSIHLLLKELKGYSKVIVGFHKADGAWKKHSFETNELTILDSISRHNNVTLAVFAKPYTLLPIYYFGNIKNVVLAYQNNDIAQTVAGEIIFGAAEAKGKIPVSINDFFKVGDGLKTVKNSNILSFSTPQRVGMNPKILSKIDILAKKAIDGKMTPGMQILVARRGKVIYQKAFGYQDYTKNNKVTNQDVYDVASLTKILSTLPNLMQLYDRHKITMETKLGDMLPIFEKTDKKNIHLKELLTHQAGLQAWIPFYQSTLDSTKHPSKQYYRKTYSAEFPLQVSENLFLRRTYNDTIMKRIAESTLSPKKEYKYSDFTFIILKEYLEKTTRHSLDYLSENNFYNSMGMSTMTYNPLRKMDVSVIPPTEMDNYFRYTKVQGYVHDMAAAMQGGVAGHAGLFSNSMDVAKMMQMYLQKGRYGDKQYFSDKTFDVFNTCVYCGTGNRRGLGFDKPQLSGAGPTCGCTSMTSFGHTGFTGTIAWADPQEDLVYVFLSNRTFPSAAENKLSKGNIREDIQKVIYESIVK
ncbi:beta-N-acetylglucosaminidase precursor [Flavobacterium enshiense DK69]|uniref:beta-N-acetylhexosaminidase n=1 Tax=Flavobacterium enshiense DK69 TaxID=1107311 RepID=V6SK91_9FLAO|nr:glycoside hydrolase family 3 N-terminal domain-containing protein [Flavobacterium enshiense]ESU24810.1 beta-N-acetylglucosaminidase precursor [Flavobacterium enshiense DK69]KGO96736.1 beta-N-acetylglucosaminidase [Flavobacterium enshiense DK69]